MRSRSPARLLAALLLFAVSPGALHGDLAPPEDQEAIWSSLTESAEQAWDREDLERAARLHREALEVARNADLGDWAVSFSANGLGAALLELGLAAEAEPHLRLGLELDRELLGPDDSELTIALENLATALLELGSVAEATGLLREAFELRNRHFPDGWEGRLEDGLELAELYQLSGDFQEAEAIYGAFLQELQTRAREARTNGDHPEALRSLDLILEVLLSASDGEPIPHLVPPLLAKADIHLDDGELDRAEESLAEIDGLVARIGPLDPSVAGAIPEVQGKLADLRGDPERAAESYRRSLEIFRGGMGPNDPTVADVSSRLASVERQLGRYRASEALTRRALEIYRAEVDPGDARLGRALNDLAVALADLGRFDEAGPLFEESVRWVREHRGEESPAYGERLMNLGMHYKEIGNLEKARETVLSGLQVLRATLPPGSPAQASGLNFLASIHREAGRFRDAEEAYRQALALDSLADTEPSTYATTLGNLGLVLADTARFGEAEETLQRALALQRRITGPEHPETALAMDNLAGLLHDLGRYEKATELLESSLAIRRRSLGDEHVQVALALNNLAMTAASRGRFTEAEGDLRRSLEIYEKAYGPEHAKVAETAANLATVYQQQGREREAEPLLRRALEVMRTVRGDAHTGVGRAGNNLGFNLASQGRDEEALDLYLGAVVNFRNALGPEHPLVAVTLDNAGRIAQQMGELEEAGEFFGRSLEISRRTLGADHPQVARTTGNLADNLRSRGQAARAEELYTRVIRILENSVGPEHPDLATALEGRAFLHEDEEEWAAALALVRRASALQESRLRRSLGSRSSGRRAERQSMRPTFLHQLALVARNLKGEPADDTGLLEEGFRAAQLARASRAAEALARMAGRFASGDGSTAALLRRRQDAQEAWRQTDRTLITALGETARNEEAIARLRSLLAELDRRIAEADRALGTEDPSYRGLVEDEPLTVSETRRLLEPGEALLVFAVGEAESYLWVVRPGSVRLVPLGLDASDLEERVTELRNGLYQAGIADAADIPPYPVASAWRLYQELLAPVQSDLEGAETLLVVPDGALQSLPLGVLVTAEFTGRLRGLSDYRNVAWMARDHGIAYLPSVGSLRALRRGAGASSAPEPLAGFGNPVLQGRRAEPVSTPGTGLLAGEIADVEAVRRLEPLSGTEDELVEIRRALGEAGGDLFLRDQATETRVKALDLTRYRVLVFATHGLVADELEGLAEPALVLTPPETGSRLDDGLLTAGEIAGLELDADWVILSACNTAAPDGSPGAERLSGLARAFFYAGGRSLLVSHWPVVSAAAEPLTGGMVRQSAGDPEISRAESLRRARVGLLEDRKRPFFAHPIFWAPFVLAGDSGPVAVPR